jgi:hypothetical protein
MFGPISSDEEALLALSILAKSDSVVDQSVYEDVCMLMCSKQQYKPLLKVRICVILIGIDL